MLFNIISKDPIRINIKDSLWISKDYISAKIETKNCIFELVNTYNNLVLAYCGGMDTSFILCCIKDLIQENKIKKDTIEIVQGIFTGGGEILTHDHSRATSFAKRLGFNPKIYTIEILDYWDRITELVPKEVYKSNSVITGPLGSFDRACQNLFVELHYPKIVLTWRIITTSSPVFNNKGLILSHNLESLIIENLIDISCWNNKIYSSMITPYQLNKSMINLSPFNHEQSELANDVLKVTEQLNRTMIYLTCYPELTKVYWKFPTISWNSWENKPDYITEYRNNYSPKILEDIIVEKEDGTYFTKKDLLNYEEICLQT